MWGVKLDDGRYYTRHANWSYRIDHALVLEDIDTALDIADEFNATVVGFEVRATADYGEPTWLHWHKKKRETA